jgi:hypothetical protein
MKPKPNPKESRAGKRAPGQTTATISLSAETLATARRLAAADGRSLSNWLRRLIDRSLAAETTTYPRPSPEPAIALLAEPVTTYKASSPGHGSHDTIRHDAIPSRHAAQEHREE